MSVIDHYSLCQLVPPIIITFCAKTVLLEPTPFNTHEVLVNIQIQKQNFYKLYYKMYKWYILE